ncbi:YceI family protein [Alteromonadaceae bacterium M269]|nr:YceI family protein [Alteromonadaceae bacterium M269]
MKKMMIASALTGLLMMPLANAADYIVDTRGAHASVNFKIKHLGYSWLTGRFDKFDGKFNYDSANPEASEITFNVDVTSLNSNHAERDKHLKNDEVLGASKHATATFTSTSVKDMGNGNLKIVGNMTLKGVTKPMTIDAEKIGEGKDPWGGYRVGFSGTTLLSLADFGVQIFGDSSHATLDIQIEGIRQ